MWKQEGYKEGDDELREVLLEFDSVENYVWDADKTEPKRTIGWKRRLAYCLHDFGDLKQLEILLVLIDTDNTELFEISVDSLRSYKDNQTMIQSNNQIIEKMKALMPKVGVATKKVFQEILDKQ